MAQKKHYQLFDFQLEIEARPNMTWAFTVLQRPFPASRGGKVLPSESKGHVEGTAVLVAWECVMEELRANKHPFTKAFKGNKKVYLDMSEASGIRLALLFQAIGTLSNREHMHTVMQGVWAMSPELAGYWFSLCQSTDYLGVASLQMLFSKGLEVTHE